jgi:hypothetical protein
MDELSRRAVLGGAVAAAAAVIWNEPVRAQFVWQKNDWHAEEFNKLVHSSRRIKAVIHANAIEDGRFIRNARNCLNGLHFGHGLPVDQVQIILALNGRANMANYDDEAWRKYHIGEFAEVKDPQTGQPSLRNIFYPSKAHYASEDPSNEESVYQDASVQALQGRGVRFLSCHTATEEAARALIKQNHLSAGPEEVAKDLVAHALPGVIVVPALAAAMAFLQSEGQYGYMAA